MSFDRRDLSIEQIAGDSERRRAKPLEGEKQIERARMKGSMEKRNSLCMTNEGALDVS